MRTHATATRQSPSRAARVAPAIGRPTRTPEIRQILRGPRLQAKLKVGQVQDRLEREADRQADRIMAMSDRDIAGPTAVQAPPMASASAPPAAQRMCTECAEEDVQTKRSDDRDSGGGFALDGQSAQAITALKGGGQPLPASERAFFEPRFKRSFAGVRIHAGQRADAAAQMIRARAFAHGDNIAFARGEYRPGSKAGRRLIAHELSHTVQQSGGQTNAVRRFATSDCSAAHAPEVVTAYRDAIAAIPQVVTKILSRPMTAATRAAFRRYFGDNSPASIGLRLYIIRHRLSNATVECENPGSLMYGTFCPNNNLAYVRSVPAFFGLGNIHVCQPQLHNLNARQRMATIVHEAAHRYLGCDDEAYFTLNCTQTAETRGLSDLQRWDNADSYGCLVHALG